MRIGIYIGSLEQFFFFNKFVKVIIENGWQLVYFASNVSILIHSHFRGINCKFITKAEITRNNPCLEKTEFVKSGVLTIDQAILYYSSVFEALSKEHIIRNFNVFFIWNGTNIPGLAFTDFAKSEKIPCLYLELANIPGKLFVDPLGVNALSSLYKNINVLKEYNVDDSTYNLWMANYIVYLKKRKLPLQIYKRYLNYFFFIDKLAYSILGVPPVGEYNLKRKYKLLRRKVNRAHDTYSIQDKKFVFYPSQISTDSQLLVNSDIDNIDAIRFANNKACELGMDLVVKIHPGEYIEEQIESIYSLKKTLGFYIVNYSTTELLQYCEKVVTINSTVGLEGLILNKEVFFLGRTFFTHLNKTYLKNYLCGYLIEVDYFNEEEIRKDIFHSILKRASINEF